MTVVSDGQHNCLARPHHKRLDEMQRASAVAVSSQRRSSTREPPLSDLLRNGVVVSSLFTFRIHTPCANHDLKARRCVQKGVASCLCTAFTASRTIGIAMRFRVT